MADTIFALSSGIGRAAIAIVRMSGPHVRAALAQLCGRVPPPRRVQLSRLRGRDGRVLDQALVLFFAGPRSETGEDAGELHLHGSRAVVRAVLDELAAIPGLRPADPGEFARRALANGKMDLLDVEALADLIDADTELQRQQAVEGGGGLLRRRAEAWRNGLLTIRAELEAGIDFSDEGDVAERLDSHTERHLQALILELERELARAQRAERVTQGFRVVLCGYPNAGKSSLLNAIARRDVAIVSDIPGTTRDSIDVSLDLGGVPVLLTDTAGVRATDDVIEAEGVRRTLDAARKADLVLWLSPADAPIPPPEWQPQREVSGVLQIVRTKADLGSADDVWANVSVCEAATVDRLLGKIEALARDALAGEPVLLTRARHVATIAAAAAAMRRALDVSGSAELCAEELRIAERSFDRLLGRINVEDVLGEIFARFCVGK